MNFDSEILSFYKNLRITRKLPSKVEVMNPYLSSETIELCEKFYKHYYHDNHSRRLLLGINPGRFGSGLTGISFTDPIRLEADCGIPNPFPKKPELSSDFIYRMIRAAGGPPAFYSKFFISAISPLGFIKEGKNINYYDDPRLEKAVTPFILSSMEQLLKMNIDRSVCFCIGEGKNCQFLQRLNNEQQWFTKIEALPHPRFIIPKLSLEMTILPKGDEY